MKNESFDWLDFAGYEQRHAVRFTQSCSLLEQAIRFTDKTRILEIGSPKAFIGEYFAKKYGSKAYFADLIPIDQKNFIQLDLQKDTILGKWDIIVCTEVLEHLSCNLQELLVKINPSLTENGIIFITVPFGFIGILKRKDKEIHSIKPIKNHLREFLPIEEHYFFKPFKIIKEEIIRNTLHNFLFERVPLFHYAVVLGKTHISK